MFNYILWLIMTVDWRLVISFDTGTFTNENTFPFLIVIRITKQQEREILRNDFFLSLFFSLLFLVLSRFAGLAENTKRGQCLLAPREDQDCSFSRRGGHKFPGNPAEGDLCRRLCSGQISLKKKRSNIKLLLVPSWDALGARRCLFLRYLTKNVHLSVFTEISLLHLQCLHLLKVKWLYRNCSHHPTQTSSTLLPQGTPCTIKALGSDSQ